MARKSPKDIKLKTDKILNAFETLAPSKNFGGMTLAQFKTAIQPSLDARALLEDLRDQRLQAIAARDAADEVTLEKLQLITNGVLADPTEGPDSALYQAFGYIRKSERRSGLTRKGSKKSGS